MSSWYPTDTILVKVLGLGDLWWCTDAQCWACLWWMVSPVVIRIVVPNGSEIISYKCCCRKACFCVYQDKLALGAVTISKATICKYLKESLFRVQTLALMLAHLRLSWVWLFRSRNDNTIVLLTKTRQAETISIQSLCWCYIPVEHTQWLSTPCRLFEARESSRQSLHSSQSSTKRVDRVRGWQNLLDSNLHPKPRNSSFLCRTVSIAFVNLTDVSPLAVINSTCCMRVCPY